MNTYESHQFHAVSFLKWIADRPEGESFALVDGNWYHETDEDGDMPLSEQDLYDIFINENPLNHIVIEK